MKCPKCGKQMVENRQKWPGLWTCPDYRQPINTEPPYRYKCTGSHLTEEGVRAFDEACMKVITERN